MWVVSEETVKEVLGGRDNRGYFQGKAGSALSVFLKLLIEEKETRIACKYSLIGYKVYIHL